MTTRRLIWIAPVLMLLLAIPATAANGSRSYGHWGEDQVFRIDMGEFEPRADSQYWDDKEFDFTADSNDYADIAVGIEWIRFLGDHLGLALSVFAYEGAASQEYVRFEDQFGGAIRHTTELEMSSLTLGILVHLTQRDRAVVPYVGIGGGFWDWRLSEFGDFIDFSTTDLEIFDDYFEDQGDALGWYWRAGLEIPVAPNWAVYAEGRWQRVDDELDRDFEGLGELDLSGETISAGLSVSF